MEATASASASKAFVAAVRPRQCRVAVLWALGSGGHCSERELALAALAVCEVNTPLLLAGMRLLERPRTRYVAMVWVGRAILAILPDGLIWARFRLWTAAAIWVS